VWTGDEDVTPRDAGAVGWIKDSDADAGDGADVVTVRPLDGAQRLTAASAGAGHRMREVISAGVVALNGDRFVEVKTTKGKKKVAAGKYLERFPVDALAELGIYILAISDGEDPQSVYGRYGDGDGDDEVDGDDENASGN